MGVLVDAEGGGGSRKTAGECHGLLAVQFSERPPRRRHPAARSGNVPITWSSHRRLPPLHMSALFTRRSVISVMKKEVWNCSKIKLIRTVN